MFASWGVVDPAYDWYPARHLDRQISTAGLLRKMKGNYHKKQNCWTYRIVIRHVSKLEKTVLPHKALGPEAVVRECPEKGR